MGYGNDVRKWAHVFLLSGTTSPQDLVQNGVLYFVSQKDAKQLHQHIVRQTQTLPNGRATVYQTVGIGSIPIV